MGSRLLLRPYTSSIQFYQGGIVSSLVKTSPVGINIGTNPTTVVGWVYLTNETFGTICSFEASSGGSRAMGLGQLAGIYYVFSDGVTINKTILKSTFDTYVGLFTWRRVAVSVSGTNVDVWIDGVNNVLSTTMTINTGSLARISIGKRFVGGVDIQPFQGYMKDFRIYNNYFTAADAAADYFDNARPYTPVSEFLMEEGSGSSVSDQVGSNTLTATSINWTTAILPMSARRLITTTDRVVQRQIPFAINVFTFAGILVNNSASLNPTDYVALEIWTKPIPGSNIVLFDNSQSGASNSYFLILDGNGSLLWYSVISGVAKNVPATTLKLNQNQWNFVSASYDGANITVMANGSLFGTVAASGTLGTNSGQLRIGQYFSVGVPVSGWISQPRIYHTNAYNLAFHRARYYDNIEDPTLNATLVLNMPMTEGFGTSIADTSGLGNNGTYSRNTWTLPDNVPFVERYKMISKQRSLSFNGSTGFGVTPTINFGGSNKVVVKGWYKFPVLNATQVIVEQSANNNFANGFVMATDPGSLGVNKLGFTMHGNTGNLYSYPKTEPLIINTWYYITCTYDGSLTTNQAKIYVNGVRSDGGYYFNNQITNTISNDQIYFGSRGGTLYFASFSVRDFSIISGKAYTAAEVMSDFANQGGVVGGTLRLSLLCNETSGSTAFDSSGNSYDLALSGGTSFPASGPSSDRSVLT